MSQWLVPEIQDSEWELEDVEVASDERPLEMAYGWMVESYSFRHDEKNIELTCNVEAYDEAPGKRAYDVYVYVDEEQEELLNFHSRYWWWNGIRDILANKSNRVVAL